MSIDRKEVIMVDVDLIAPDPNQPRTVFDNDSIANMATTIEGQGLINPVEIDEDYMIVTGEIRWKAAKKAGLKQIPCIVWKNGKHKRFERQVIENLHRNDLNDTDKESAIVKLWDSEQYPNIEQLAKSIGLGKTWVNEIIAAAKFRKNTPNFQQLESISTRDIAQTRYIENPEHRLKILEKIAKDKLKESGDPTKIKAEDIAKLAKLAKTSSQLLDKVLDEKIRVDRAEEAADKIIETEKMGMLFTDDQKQSLADNIAQDQDLIKKYEREVLEKVKQVVTRPKDAPRITEPIGRTSPVNNIIKVKDEVMDRFRIYIGNCNTNERKWALKTLKEIKEEIDFLVALLERD